MTSILTGKMLIAFWYLVSFHLVASVQWTIRARAMLRNQTRRDRKSVGFYGEIGGICEQLRHVR